MRLVSNSAEGIERALDALTLRQQALAGNIANINTPGYVKHEVHFEDSLREALNEAEAPKANAYESASGSIDGLTFGSGPSGFGGGFGGPDGASVTDAAPDVLLTWQPKTSQSPDGAQRLDGNHTPIESQMSEMAMNTVRYNTLVAVVQKQYSILKNVAQAK